MKIWVFVTIFFVIVELDQSEAFLKKLKKLFDGKGKKDCEVRWEEHTQPHCTTTYDKHCETEYKNECKSEYTTECKQESSRQCKTEWEENCETEHKEHCETEYTKECETEYKEQCTTEYTEECWDEPEEVCQSHPECHTTYVDKCTPLFKKHCHEQSPPPTKKWKREAVEDPEEAAALEELKKLSASDLLEIAHDAARAEADNEDGKEKRVAGIVALKLIKKFLKGKKDKGVADEPDCEDIPHGEHCEKVPVEKCHDVEKCWKEPRTACKKVPHEKCWQEPHEKCWQEPHEKCWQEPQEKCWKEPHEKCWDEPHEKCWQEPHEKCWKEPHEHCTDVPKEHCDYVKIKVAKRWCFDPKEEDHEKDSGKKFWKKLGKLIGHGQ